MLIAIVTLALFNLILLLTLLLRKAAPSGVEPALAALPEQLTRQTVEEGRQTRKEQAEAASILRTEVADAMRAVSSDLNKNLRELRQEHSEAATHLRADVEQKMRILSQDFAAFKNETSEKQGLLEKSVHGNLLELMKSNTSHQENLRTAVEGRLDKLNTDNAAKLEQMRATVDEKLHATLQTRLTESFGQVTDQLTKVHAGLGEMTKLSAGVDDLSRIFTNVKSRGQFAEAMLDNLLKQMLAENQFSRNVQVKPGTQESVEFAVRFPGHDGEILLPIDSKFPRESWERLETAYESGNAKDIESARKVFESAIRTEGKRICSKYIHEPVTTPVAIMFLPTEGLYAEVMRRDGLYDDMQRNCKVLVAGPSTLAAVLTSFQMVFQLANLQKKGNEVWTVLATARNEFEKFGGLMDKMDKQVGTVQNTIRDLSVRTRAINRTLRDVSLDGTAGALSAPGTNGFDGLLPLLAAVESEE